MSDEQIGATSFGWLRLVEANRVASFALFGRCQTMSPARQSPNHSRDRMTGVKTCGMAVNRLLGSGDDDCGGQPP